MISGATDTAGVAVDLVLPALLGGEVAWEIAAFYEVAEVFGPVTIFFAAEAALLESNDPSNQLKWASGLKYSDGTPIVNPDGTKFEFDTSNFTVEEHGVTSSAQINPGENVIVGGSPSDDFDASTFSVEDHGVTSSVPIDPSDNVIDLRWAPILIPPLQ